MDNHHPPNHTNYKARLAKTSLFTTQNFLLTCPQKKQVRGDGQTARAASLHCTNHCQPFITVPKNSALQLDSGEPHCSVQPHQPADQKLIGEGSLCTDQLLRDQAGKYILLVKLSCALSAAIPPICRRS